MRVVRVVRFGGPEVLEPGEAPDPVPGVGELLVDVAMAEVLFLDTQLRAGWGREFFSIEPPFVPGEGVTGTVAAVGDGVDDAWLGRRVIVGLSPAGAYRGGGYAERAVAAAEAAIPVPDRLELRDAIAALHDGMMGVGRFEKARLGAGDVALVTAAGGGIGAWLIPLAARAGVTVVAAARGERKLALARERGAHVAVDYSDEDWPARVRSELAERDVDAVFDGAGGPVGARAFELTGRGARFFSYGAASGEFAGVEGGAEQGGVRVFGIDDPLSPADQRRNVEAALAHLAAGAIEPVIGQVVALEHACEAHAAIAERRVVGKTLLATSAGEDG